MNFSFIWSQIFGALGVLCAITSYNLKKKNEILIALILANLMFAIQYFCLSAWSGLLCSVIAMIRSFVYYHYEKQNKKKPVFVLIIFLTLLVGIELLVYQDAFSLLPLIGTIGFTWTLWLSNPKHYRKAAALDPILYFAYDLHVLAFADLPLLVFEFIGALVAIIRLDIKKIKVR